MRLFPWDYAAASLILSEAGGVIRSLNDEEAPLDRPTLLVAANNQENYKKLSSIVNKHIKVLPY
jgi:myo-inositol-1(or 4)-monophosphatase